MFQFWGAWSFAWGLCPPKPPRGDGIDGKHHNFITTLVSPRLETYKRKASHQ